MKYHAASGLAFPDADTFMLRETAADGSYQRAHLETALRYVTDFSTAIDAGAHVGSWTLLLARQFARVVAVEPSADTFECLERNLMLKACRNVSALNLALGAEAGRTGMTLDPANAARQNTGGRRLAAGTSVPVETIDSWHLPSLGFLKLDVEGSEPAVLEGARDTLARCKPVVLFEGKWLWTRYYGLPKNAVEVILTAARYRFAEKIGHDQVWVPAR